MPVQTITWRKGKAVIIDQTRLPHKLVYLDIEDVKSMWMPLKRER